MDMSQFIQMSEEEWMTFCVKIGNLRKKSQCEKLEEKQDFCFSCLERCDLDRDVFCSQCRSEDDF